jgi:tetratricopeptide (TPR) repeat protein
MAGGVTRLLSSYEGLLVGRFRFVFPAPLARFMTRKLGIQNGIANYYYAEAHKFASRGEYERGIRSCRASLAARLDNVPAYEVLAQVFTHLGRYEEALEACAGALAVMPDSQAITASLQQLLPLVGQSKHPERMIAILEKCLAANPARGDVLTLLIQMLLRSRRYVEAVRACQRILEVDPEFFPAAETIRNLLKDPQAQLALSGLPISPPPSLSEEYDWLVASNVLDTLINVMSKFYSQLGVDLQYVPLLQGLENFRRKLSAEKPETNKSEPQSTLILFETAWKQYQAGQTKEALRAFESIFNDFAARQKTDHNHFLKEAVVRSGEILGRHYDTLGEVETAIGIYRNVMSLDHNNLVARRLVLLLSRTGRLSEAVTFAEKAIISQPNLFRYIPPNRHIAALKAEISFKPTGA